MNDYVTSICLLQKGPHIAGCRKWKTGRVKKGQTD